MHLTDLARVEKYRPDTIEDVSGHQDVLATINRFVECNVCLSFLLDTRFRVTEQQLAPAAFASLWTSGNRENIHDFGAGKADIWE